MDTKTAYGSLGYADIYSFTLHIASKVIMMVVFRTLQPTAETTKEVLNIQIQSEICSNKTRKTLLHSCRIIYAGLNDCSLALIGDLKLASVLSVYVHRCTQT